MKASSGTGALPLTLDAKLGAVPAALLVIDMQNDFCAPEGYVARTVGKDVGAAAAMVPALETLIARARAAAIPVVWIRADYSLSRIPRPMQAKLINAGITNECCKPGSWGADWFGVAPRADEVVIDKHTYSGFAGTALQETLQRLRIETVVCTGVQTQICVESTVRDAHSLGYFCIVVEDAVASHAAALHQASLTNLAFLFGDVCSSATVNAAWSSLPRS